MWIDPESFDAPDPNPLRRLSIINVGSLERMLRTVPADTPVFIDHSECDEEEYPPLLGVYYATKIRGKVEYLDWKRLENASEASDAVAILIKS